MDGTYEAVQPEGVRRDSGGKPRNLFGQLPAADNLNILRNSKLKEVLTDPYENKITRHNASALHTSDVVYEVEPHCGCASDPTFEKRSGALLHQRRQAP